MTKRDAAKGVAVLDEVRVAADAFRDSLVKRADEMRHGVYPLWHGWALHDAFVAGAAWQANRRPK